MSRLSIGRFGSALDRLGLLGIEPGCESVSDVISAFRSSTMRPVRMS